MQNTKQRTPFLKNPMVQTIIASLVCIVLGVLIGYIALLIINPNGANDAILAVLENFWTYSKPATQLKNFGNTLAKTAPLLMCSLSVLFAYKVGLFNIGAAGQYVVGAGASLYLALQFGCPWYVCLLAALLAGALLGAISGMLKSFCNVNEVISCIMLNWISLYGVNMLLSEVKDLSSPYTLKLTKVNPGALLPTLGLDEVFGSKYVTIAVPLAIIFAILVWVVLSKTKLGYELKATGLNKNAARYCGMKERSNIILTMAIAGALAAMGAAFLFLSGYEEWSCTQSSVPGMGFNGIAAAFLGGLNPIGSVFSSYFIQHITMGGGYVDKTMYCAQISDFISSVIIYLCGFVLFFKQSMTKAVDSGIERRNEEIRRVAAKLVDERMAEQTAATRKLVNETREQMTGMVEEKMAACANDEMQPLPSVASETFEPVFDAVDELTDEDAAPEMPAEIEPLSEKKKDKKGKKKKDKKDKKAEKEKKGGEWA